MAKMRKVNLASGLEIEVGSGNVYEDLGFKNADAMLARASIVAEIVRIIRARWASPDFSDGSLSL